MRYLLIALVLLSVVGCKTTTVSSIQIEGAINHDPRYCIKVETQWRK
jgi:hypothetical protein